MRLKSLFRPSNKTILAWARLVAEELGKPPDYRSSSTLVYNHPLILIELYDNPSSDIINLSIVRIVSRRQRPPTSVFRHTSVAGLERYNYGEWVGTLRSLAREARSAKRLRLEREHNDKFGDVD